MAMNKTQVPAAQKSVLSMLIDDHREAQQNFKKFKSVHENSQKKEIVQKTCTALTAHTEIEEKIFYPYLRDTDPKAFGSLLNEALVEHNSAKELISELEQMQPGDDLYNAHFTVLGEYVNHHITEEEDELFPKVIDKSISLADLGKPMRETKKSVMEAKNAATQ